MDIPKQLLSEEWRLGNLYHIIDKEGKLIVFKHNEYQLRFKAERAARNIVLKSRQLGFTTQACIEMLDCIIFHRNYNAVIIAHDMESMYRIFQKVAVAWANFPKHLKDYLKIDSVRQSQSEIYLNNGSRISVTLSSRSDTVNWLHISEYGKICAKYPQKAREIITGALPSVPVGGRVTFESTAEGEEGRFADMFWEAWNRDTEPQGYQQYKAFFFPWTKDRTLTTNIREDLSIEMRERQKQYDLTDSQIHWYAQEKKMQKERMAQEYPTTPEEAFVSSGAKVLDPKIISRLLQEIKIRREKNIWDEPTVVGYWNYFIPYVAGHRYAMGVDVAGGSGRDHSSCVIIDFTNKTPIIVARYMNNRITPELLPYEVIAGAKAYGNPLVAVEANNHGHTTITILKDTYPNLYQETKKDALTDVETTKVGFLTTLSSKPRIVFNFKHAIEENDILIPDPVILREARKFDHGDLTITKVPDDEEFSRHFDCFMASCIAYEMREYVGSYSQVNMVEPSEPFDPHSIM